MATEAPDEMQWSFADDEGYLRVETWGMVPAELDASLAYIESIRDEAAARGAGRILIDRRRVVQRPEGDASALLLERVAEIFLEQRFDDPDRRIAVLTPGEHLPRVRSAETLFQAQGLHIRYFSHEDDAVGWLSEGARDRRD